LRDTIVKIPFISAIEFLTGYDTILHDDSCIRSLHTPCVQERPAFYEACLNGNQAGPGKDSRLLTEQEKE
jgi:hypothetical protein